MQMKWLSLKKLMVTFSFVLACQGLLWGGPARAGDWPQYRAEAGRSGYTAEQLPANLSLAWKYQQPAPTPAWTGMHTRMVFDHVYEPIISQNTLYFGSSTDHKVYALDAATGAERWTFFTEAPVRLTPAAWKDRVFVTSDDGRLYCLSADTGKLLWKKDPPAEAYKLGNDRMISNWPARGGVAIKDDVLYYGVGIWPTDNIYIYALNPTTGEQIWVNDKCGPMFWDQPHTSTQANSGISAQGHLVVAGNHVYVPTGRAVPAALDSKTGELKYFHLQQYRDFGGSRTFATDKHLFVTSGNTRHLNELIGQRNAIFDAESGLLPTTYELDSSGLAFNANKDQLFYIKATDRHLQAHSLEQLLVEKVEKNRKGETVTNKYLANPLWTMKTIEPADTLTLILAGNMLVAGTENNKVTMIDTEAKRIVWAVEVDGLPYGLAVADGKLYVSTDKGTIYCFDADQKPVPVVHAKTIINNPYGENSAFATAAEAIIQESGVTRGYALDVGCGDGALTYELAKRTNLYIVAIDDDPANVEAARQKLDAAGLYGRRVVVQHSDLSAAKYPNYFANLIVSAKAVKEGESAVDMNAVARVQRPEGGVMLIGKAGVMRKTVRPALAGAGEWTHLYANPANTLSSNDTLVKGELGMLWWNDPAMDMPSRHGRGPSPLYKDGIVYVQGVDEIRAYDAYNGSELWRLYVEDIGKPYDHDNWSFGVNVTGGNYALDGDSLYVRLGLQPSSAFQYVLRLDAKTGEIVGEYRVPEVTEKGIDLQASYYDQGAKAGWGYDPYPMWSTQTWHYLPDYDYDAGSQWGYIAVQNGTLYGGIVNTDYKLESGSSSYLGNPLTETKFFFAMDAETGTLKWVYTAEHSIRHNTIAIADNKVFLVDRPPSQQDRLQHPGETQIPKGKLVALDAQTGQKLYEKSNDVEGTLLAVSAKHDVLVMTYNYHRGALPSEIGGSLKGFRASTGELLWDASPNVGPKRTSDGVKRLLAEANNKEQYPYASHVVILENEQIVFLEPYAFDLLTGEQKEFQFDRSYNCGIISASDRMLVYRSGTLGYMDVANWQEGTYNWGGFRPACWVNTIPAGGIVLIPEAIEDCDCSYLMIASVALEPK